MVHVETYYDFLFVIWCCVTTYKQCCFKLKEINHVIWFLIIPSKQRELLTDSFIIHFSAFCPLEYPYSTNFGRICCQEKPDRDAFLNEFCRKEQVGTCQAFNVNEKFRCGNHQSVEENCMYTYLLDTIWEFFINFRIKWSLNWVKNSTFS